MNSEAISAIIAKHATLKTSKAKLEAMEAGTYVVHRSWGFGQIKEYDESDMKLVIDFKGKKSHRMGPCFLRRQHGRSPRKAHFGPQRDRT